MSIWSIWIRSEDPIPESFFWYTMLSWKRTSFSEAFHEKTNFKRYMPRNHEKQISVVTSCFHFRTHIRCFIVGITRRFSLFPGLYDIIPIVPWNCFLYFASMPLLAKLDGKYAFAYVFPTSRKFNLAYASPVAVAFFLLPLSLLRTKVFRLFQSCLRIYFMKPVFCRDEEPTRRGGSI